MSRYEDLAGRSAGAQSGFTADTSIARELHPAAPILFATMCLFTSDISNKCK